MTDAYEGCVLRVDLTAGSITTEKLPGVLLRRYGGGSCLAMVYMLREVDPGIDPLSPENLLIFAASVMTGAPLSGLSRFNITARSPLTGTIGDSQGGGFWGAELKRAGFEAILIRGQAPRPVMLWVSDGEAELLPAEHLWGLDTAPAQRRIREELGDAQVRVALIGRGGENQVRFANVANELHHFNGRTGMGAVMGAKRLKAIAVRGRGHVPIVDPETLLALARSAPQRIAENSGASLLRRLGTAGFVLPTNETGALPTRNFRSGYFEGAGEISGEAMHARLTARATTCYACAVRCKQVVESGEPYQIDPAYGGPEYEGLAALGSYTGVEDLQAVSKANELCNRYTLDVITCGGMIAWAMDCYERRIIGHEQTGGIELRFGDGGALVKLVEMIAHREGIGDVLAEGPERASKEWGPAAAALAVHTKGQIFPAHMPRTKASLGVVYATNPYGADHLSTEHDPFLLPEMPRELRARMAALGMLETASLEETGPIKMRLAALSQRFMSLLDSLELCSFCFGSGWFFDSHDLVTAVRAVTGWKTNMWELMRIGERRINLMRAFNVREGLRAADDVLPARVAEPLEGGVTDGGRLDMEAWREDKALYYAMMGWDSYGVPTRAKLHELELGWVIEELETRGVTLT
jgi:aldehyde:ferredoxin oxidoreductase